MAKNTDELETSDYKTTKDGKKIRAHRIVFNKGEEDNTKLSEESELDERTLSGSEMNKREDIVKGMKKNYKGFVSKYGKDRAKSVMYATATKLAKEETEMKDNLDEAKKANTASARAELAKRPAKPLTGADADKKKKESDDAWERLMAHAASKGKSVKEESELVDEELKGNQHKLDKNKNGKLDKKDFELIRKEETEQVEERVKGFSQKPAPTGSKSDSPGFQEYLKKQREKRAAAAATGSMKKEEVEMMDEAHPFDIPKSSGMATSTKTKHDVKKTSTGTVYTKQRDADGMAKEFKRDPDEAKRGRGRPKKNSFSEAAEFLMSLTEEQFDDVTSEGFDIFFESFENINK
jgi:hypothetical protein